MNALRQLLSKLSHGEALNGDDLIALLLVTAMAASMIQLLTILATRWGDRHLALKSLAASVLIHCVCLLGLEVFDPMTAANTAAREQPPENQKPQSQILVESEADVPLTESGNTPLADRPSQPEIELHRLDVAAPELTPSVIPQPEPDKLEAITTTTSDVTQFEERKMSELAIASDAGVEGPRQPSVADPAADVQTMLSQNTADVPSLQKSRTRREPGNPDDQTQEKDPLMPLAATPELRIRPTSEDVALPLPSAADSELSLPDSIPDRDDAIERRTSPVVATNPSDTGGLAVNVPQPRPGPSRSFQSRLPRPDRAMQEREDALKPPLDSALIPRTPIPLTQDYEDVRVGITAPDFSEAIVSGGELVAADLPTIRRRDNPPPTYALRNVEQRSDAALRFGGTKESEAAVELSLRWLARNQQADGRWDAEDWGAGQVKLDEIGVDRNYAGREADSGLSALVTLCFLGAGATHETGRYALVVDHGLDWIIQQQAPDGNLSGKAEHFARMYCHAMATYALAEAYGMQKEQILGPIMPPEMLAEANLLAARASAVCASMAFHQPMLCLPLTEPLHRMTADRTGYSLRRVDDLRLRTALVRAVTYTIGQQDPRSGGWRYKFGQEGDVSMFGWHMMSLKSAEIAGVSIDPRVRQRMNLFLNSVRQGENGGLFGYRRNYKVNDRDVEPVSPVMTAEALFCQQMLGYPRDSESSRESVGFLLRNMPRLSEVNYYYWYYGTLAMYQFGGRPWDDWNTVVRDTLISQQRTDGELTGSWDPADRWGRYGGRLYSTALATLTLEVYYRLLPLYRLNEVRPTK